MVGERDHPLRVPVPDVHAWEAKGQGIDMREALNVFETYHALALGSTLDNPYTLLRNAILLALH